MKSKSIGLTGGAAVLAFVAGGLLHTLGGDVAVADELAPEIAVIQDADETTDHLYAGLAADENIPTKNISQAVVVNGVAVEIVEPFFTAEFKDEMGLSLERSCIAFQDSPNSLLIQATVDRPVEIGAIAIRAVNALGGFLTFPDDNSHVIALNGSPDGAFIDPRELERLWLGEPIAVPVQTFFELQLVDSSSGEAGEAAWRLTFQEQTVTDVRLNGVNNDIPLLSRCRSFVLFAPDLWTVRATAR